MKKHKLTPCNIYNVEETSVTNPGKGQRRMGSVTSRERGKNITVCVICAAGKFISSTFIFHRQRMIQLLEKDGPSGAMYTSLKMAG